MEKDEIRWLRVCPLCRCLLTENQKHICNKKPMKVSNNYIAVKKIEETIKEGFQTVEIQDSSLFKGEVTHLPDAPVYIGNKQIKLGDTVLFAKYSPDTHEIENEGIKYKFISTRDLLAILL